MVMQVVVDFVRQIVSEINQNILAVVVEKRDKQEVPNIIKGFKQWKGVEVFLNKVGVFLLYGAIIIMKIDGITSHISTKYYGNIVIIIIGLSFTANH